MHKLWHLALILSFLSTTSPSASGDETFAEYVLPNIQDGVNLILKGQVEIDDSPQVNDFESRVRADREMPCILLTSLPRLLRSAHNPELRCVVWQRMQQQELFWVGSKTLARVESYANSFNMPLVR